MHIRRFFGALCLAVLAMAPPAYAEDGQMTLADFREICAAKDQYSQAACLYYVLGAFEGLSVGGDAKPQGGSPRFGERPDKAFCVPPGLSGDEMRRQVLRNADMDIAMFPEDAKMPAIAFIGAVVTKLYPCASR